LNERETRKPAFCSADIFQEDNNSSAARRTDVLTTSEPNSRQSALRRLSVWLKNHLTTRCWREQSGKSRRSLIRPPFVPALIEPLTQPIYCGVGGAGSRTSITAQTTHRKPPRKHRHTQSANIEIQHLVGKSDSKSTLSREQTLNQPESAIRL
jgi:hypothetical protein